MKKRCTESSCRRVFTYNNKEEGIVCPYCGKEYPKLGQGTQKVICKVNGKAIDFTFLLKKLDTTYSNKVKMVKAIRFGGDFGETMGTAIPEDQKQLHLGLKQAKQIADFFWKTGKFPTVIIVPADGDVKILKSQKFEI